MAGTPGPRGATPQTSWTLYHRDPGLGFRLEGLGFRVGLGLGG